MTRSVKLTHMGRYKWPLYYCSQPCILIPGEVLLHRIIYPASHRKNAMENGQFTTQVQKMHSNFFVHRNHSVSKGIKAQRLQNCLTKFEHLLNLLSVVAPILILLYCLQQVWREHSECTLKLNIYIDHQVFTTAILVHFYDAWRCLWHKRGVVVILQCLECN